METIWKYALEVNDKQTVLMPLGAKILTVQTQYKHPCIWVLIDTNEKLTEYRMFEMFDTGHEIHSDMGVDREYIGTFQINGGALVFHLFERKN